MRKFALTNNNRTSNADDVRGYPFVKAVHDLSPGGIMQLKG